MAAILALLVIFVACLPASAAPTGENVVIGYYFLSPEQINNYDDAIPKVVPFPITNITPDKPRQLTHINFAFLDINDRGECSWDAKVSQPKPVKSPRA